MNVTVDKRKGSKVAVVHTKEAVMTDAASALEVLFNVRHYTGCDSMVAGMNAFSDDFFDLTTGLAGSILQKYVNYHIKLAIYGDFSGFESNALNAFIIECNRGKDIFFLPSREEALEKLHSLHKANPAL